MELMAVDMLVTVVVLAETVQLVVRGRMAVVVLVDILEMVHLDMRALVHLVALVGLDNITQVLME
jgi:hypothetical protein